MDKTQALEVLIKHSFLLTDEVKAKLIVKLPSLAEEEIDNLGIFLAVEKQKSLEGNQQIIADIDQLLAILEKTQPAQV